MTRTIHQELAMARDFYGKVIHVRPFEKVLKVKIEDELLVVLFETYAFRESSTKVVFTKRGKRLWSFDRAAHLVDEEIFWDEDFIPEVLDKTGRLKTGEAARDQREYERMCYRPGSSRNPLDNYSRVTSAPTTDAMRRHFK